MRSEGLGTELLDSQAATSNSARHRPWSLIPGLCIVVPLAGVATIFGHLLPIVGAPVFAIVGGIVIARLRPPPAMTRPGIGFATKTVLQGSIVLLGTGLSFGQVLHTGSSSLPVLIGTLSVALIGSSVLGRALSIQKDLRTLIGVGTAICGASAIAATDSVISASEADVSYAIATIFTFNVVAVLTFPTLGHLLSMSPHTFGVWAGTAVNDLSSVVAASSIFGHGATSTAVVVKLTRTLMIVPIALGLGWWRNRHLDKATGVVPGESSPGRVGHLVPVFIGLFLVSVGLNTFGVVPSTWHSVLSQVAQVLITVALAAIGLSTRVHDVRKAGFRPLALGAVLWALVAVTSLLIQLA